MFSKKELLKVMKDGIINSEGIPYLNNSFYWLQQLNYSKDTSHPEHKILEDYISKDIKILEEAELIREKYRRIGIAI